MPESDLSARLIKILRSQYGRSIWLQKRSAVDVKGEPDISGTFAGRSIFFEVKACNNISKQNTHPFSKIQVHELKVREGAGAFAVGVLVLDLHQYENYLKAPTLLDADCGVRYVMPADIPENGIVHYEGAKDLDLLITHYANALTHGNNAL